MKYNFPMKRIKQPQLLLFLIIFSVKTTLAQTFINAPIKEFGNICASASFNSYSANFDFNGFPVGTTFVLEMSDANGSFTNLTPIQIISSQFNISPGKFTFKVPENTSTAGKKYKMRVKTTNFSPQVVSIGSPEFQAYYRIFNDAITVNNKSSSLNVCGTTGTISIDAAAPSPLAFTDLKYIWFKDNVAINGQTGSSLSVTAAGTYYVAVDYGDCTPTSNSKSNDIVVTFTTSSASYSITSSLGNNVCPGTPTTLSTTPGQTYQWYRDNVIISGASSFNHITQIPGVYKVVVSPGTACETTSSTFALTAEDFNLSIDALVDPATNVIPVGDTITITATTDASSPTFTWLDPTNTTVSTINTFSTATPIAGIYKLIVQQTTGCIFSKEIKFKIKNGVVATKIPNTISPNDDGINDTWIIPQEFIAPDVEVLIVDSFGKEVINTANYQQDWPTKKIEVKGVNPIFYYIISKNGSPLKKGSISVIK
jgi:gliding motility-associated-like protein